MINSGVYQIINKVNGHRYVGSSVNLSGRKCNHFIMLKNGGGSNIILKNACTKYGIDNLEFQILLYCDPEMCVIYEQMIMDAFHPTYNISPTAGSTLGIKASDETKQKLSDALKGRTSPMKGKKHSVETRRKISDANIGKKMSEESKLKMSESMQGNTNCTGRKLSKEHKQKLYAANIGRKMSEKSKRKMSEAHKGKKLSEEAKRKVSESLKGNTRRLGTRLSDEHKRAISIANKGKNNPFYGKKHSEETRRKMRGPRKKHIDV